MEIIQGLEAYTSAQKAVGASFIFLGVFLLLLAGLVWFFAPAGQLTNGLKMGFLISGLLIGMGGFSYLNFSADVLHNGSQLYEKGKTEFVKSENERMQKVEKGYPVYQMVFAIFITLALAVIFFVNRPFWSGISFAVIILFTGIMIVEAYSHKSIYCYAEELKVEIGK